MSAGVSSPVDRDRFPRLPDALSSSVRSWPQNTPSTAVATGVPSVPFRFGKSWRAVQCRGVLGNKPFCVSKARGLQCFPRCLVLNVDLKTAVRSGDVPSCGSAGQDWFTGSAGAGAGLLLQEGPHCAGTALVSSSVTCFPVLGFRRNSGGTVPVVWQESLAGVEGRQEGHRAPLPGCVSRGCRLLGLWLPSPTSVTVSSLVLKPCPRPWVSPSLQALTSPA